MKGLSKKKLLEKLCEWFETVADYGYREDSEAYEQIKKLIENKPKVEVFHSPIVSFDKIENKPKVTKAFVKKWLEEFLYGAPESYPMIIKAMLKEAGIEVKK